MKGQISAEMIIILAILLAIIFIVAQQLTSLGQRASAEANKTAEKTFEIIQTVTGSCTTDDDCPVGQLCIAGKCT